MKKYLKLDAKHERSFRSYLDHEKNYTSAAELTNFYDVLKYILKMCAGILLSDLVHFFKYNKTRKPLKSIIYVTHYSYIIKGVILNEFSKDDDLSILYVPTLHSKEMKNHFNHFKKNDNIIFDYFGFKPLYKSLLLIKDIPFFLSLKEELNSDFSFTIRSIIKYKLFSFYSEKLLDKNSNSNIWLFDNDKTPNFSPIVKALEIRNQKTINVQHGTFFKNNSFYLPSTTSFIFCCSEREKQLFIESGSSAKDIFIIGAPLQVFSHKLEKKEELEPIYDILILLTTTVTEEYSNFQIKLISNLKKYDDLKILLRFRPASKKEDFERLKTHIPTNLEISTEKNINIDIQRSKKIISLSFDALFNCKILKKDTVIICNEEIKNELFDSNNPLVFSTNDTVDIDSFLNGEYASNYEDNFNLNFGDTNAQTVQKNILNAIEIIKERNGI